MKRTRIKFALILVLFLLAAGTSSYLFLLPRYIEKNILPSLGERISSSLTGKVFTLGINEASLGDIIIGDKQNVALSIGSIRVNYSLASLWDKKIDQVKINGLNLNLEISGGEIIIPGLDLRKITDTKTKHSESRQSSPISMPLQLDSFKVSNGFLNILYEKQRIFIPFDLQITRKEQLNEKTLPAYRLNLQIFPRGENITVTGTADLSSNKGIFAISAKSLDMKQFAFLMGRAQEILNLGKVAVKASTEIQLLPFQLVATEIDCELESADFKNAQVSFGSSKVNDDATRALQLRITGNEQQWDINAHGFMVVPLAATITLKGSFFPGDNAAKGSGSILFSTADKSEKGVTARLPFKIKGDSELHGDFSVDARPGSWQAEIKSSASKGNLGISYGQNSLKSKAPSFAIQGKGTADTTQIEVLLAIPDVHVTGRDSSEIILPKADLLATFIQEKKSAQAGLSSGNFTLLLPDAKIKKDSLTARADISLSGKMKPQLLQDIESSEITGELTVRNAQAEEQQNSVKVSSIKGRIPWQWPLSSAETTGRLTVAGIKWKNNELGSFEADVRQKGSSYSMDGSFNHSFPAGLTTTVTGQAGIIDSEYLAEMILHMDVTPFSSLHLGKFDTSMSNSYINGELGLDGELKFDAKGLTGNLAVLMQNGNFEYPEKKYTINNINLSLFIPSLPDLRSAPAQKLLFDRASIGDLTFEKGKVIWQLESPDSIFIEEGVVRWVGGRVFTNAVRISPETDELVVPIFCDRLILSEVLTQFGVTGAAGEGTVSGRIPLHVSKGTIRFEDGFLYSSPGQGGSVKVAAFDLLSAGIPKNTPQFAQVDFAAEALKNFQYNWVRLLLNSEGEDLVMQMQMDGKPVQSLPFIYDSRTGSLQRADETKKGIHQPIRLDVNFRLPLNRFLGYSGKIQDIMKNLQ